MLYYYLEGIKSFSFSYCKAGLNERSKLDRGNFSPEKEIIFRARLLKSRNDRRRARLFTLLILRINPVAR